MLGLTWVCLRSRICLLTGAINESCNSDSKRMHSIVYSSSFLFSHFSSDSFFFSFVAKLLELVLFAFGLFDSSMFVDAIFGIFLQKNFTYILSDLFHFFSRLLLHCSRHSMDWMNFFPRMVWHQDRCLCWAGFNLIFLINSNSFKYMHQQQFTLDKQCTLVFGIQATAFTTTTASFHISKMSKFVVYLRANIKSI